MTSGTLQMSVEIDLRDICKKRNFDQNREIVEFLNSGGEVLFDENLLESPHDDLLPLNNLDDLAKDFSPIHRKSLGTSK